MGSRLLAPQTCTRDHSYTIYLNLFQLGKAPSNPFVTATPLFQQHQPNSLVAHLEIPPIASMCKTNLFNAGSLILMKSFAPPRLPSAWNRHDQSSRRCTCRAKAKRPSVRDQDRTTGVPLFGPMCFASAPSLYFLGSRARAVSFASF